MYVFHYNYIKRNYDENAKLLFTDTDSLCYEIKTEDFKDGKKITRVAESKSLGVYIDETLSWKKHMKELSKKIASGIGALKRLMPFISKDTAVIIYKALIEPHFDYCSSVWYGISDTLSQKLQKLQNRAARVITKSTYDTSAKPLLNSLNWDDLATRRKKQLLISVFKSIHGLSPPTFKICLSSATRATILEI